MSPAPAAEADAIIARLGLQPHPEGGHFVETYRHSAAGGSRGLVTAIYFLLRAGETSRWHRVKGAVEIWLYHAGAALELAVSGDSGLARTHRLGIDFASGERPQAVVPIGAWQSARSVGAWTLASCTVAPAFEFAGFELAPPGWRPGEGG